MCWFTLLPPFFFDKNDVHEMRYIETVAVILPYAGYCQNDTCYKTEVIMELKGKKYSCCEKIIKIASNCGKLIGAIICTSRCYDTRKWRMTTGVMWMSWWVVWGQTNSVNMHTRQALVLPKQMKVKHLPCYHNFVHKFVTIVLELQLPP